MAIIDIFREWLGMRKPMVAPLDKKVRFEPLQAAKTGEMADARNGIGAVAAQRQLF